MTREDRDARVGGEISEDPLETRADANLVDELFAARAIGGKARAAALAWLQDRGSWIAFADRFLLMVGSVCLVAGILFFFAFNWASLRPWMRFVLLQTAFLGAALGAWTRGPDAPSGQALHLAAAFLVGVNLAVYGQVYQTGADPWELFAGWSVLLIPWLLAFPHRGFLALWCVLVNLTWALVGDQVLEAEGWIETWDIPFGAAILVLAFLVVHEWRKAGRARRDGASPGEIAPGEWLRWFFLTAMLVLVSFPALEVLAHRLPRVRGLAQGLALLVLLAVGPLAHWLFGGEKGPVDLVSLTLVGFCLEVHVLAWLGRFVFEIRPYLIGFGLMTVAVVACTAGLVHYLKLRRVRRPAGEEARS